MSDINELMEALSVYAWTEAAPSVTIPRFVSDRFTREYLELRCWVKLPAEGLSATTDNEVRRYLLLNAEQVLAVVYRHGWRHVRAPRIEFDGDIGWPDGFRVGAPRVVHQCEVRLEIERGSGS